MKQLYFTIQVTSSSISSIDYDADVSPEIIALTNSRIETQATSKHINCIKKNGVLFNKVKLKGFTVGLKICFCTYLIRLLYYCNLSYFYCNIPENHFNVKVNKRNNKYIKITIVACVHFNLKSSRML